MWGFVISVAQQAAGFFFGGAGSVTDTTVKDAVIGVYAGLQALSNFLQSLLGDEMVAWRKAGPQVVDGGRGLGNLAFNELFAWTRLLHTILPGSLSWLWGFVWRWGTPKFNRIWRLLAILDRRTKSLDHWRAHWAGPWITNWIHFRRFYFTWPNHTIAIVHNWLRQPRRFAAWATPVLVPSFIRWLTPPHHVTERDAWAKATLATLPDVINAVDQTAVRLLETPFS